MGRLTVVLDASVVVELIVEEGARNVAEALLDHDLVVPGHFRTEVAAALVRGERRGLLPSDRVQRAIDEVGTIPAKVHIPTLATIVAVARKHSIGAYDAAYLAAAHEVDGLLATLDETLAKAAKLEKRLWHAPSAKQKAVSFLRNNASADAKALLAEFQAKHGPTSAKAFLALASA